MRHEQRNGHDWGVVFGSATCTGAGRWLASLGCDHLRLYRLMKIQKSHVSVNWYGQDARRLSVAWALFGGRRRRCQGRHRACPYRRLEGGTERVARLGEGRHKACPYRRSQGGTERVARLGEGRHKACPYRRSQGGTERVARLGEGRHKACPYRRSQGGTERVARLGEGRHKACPYRSG